MLYVSLQRHGGVRAPRVSPRHRGGPRLLVQAPPPWPPDHREGGPASPFTPQGCRPCRGRSPASGHSAEITTKGMEVRGFQRGIGAHLEPQLSERAWKKDAQWLRLPLSAKAGLKGPGHTKKDGSQPLSVETRPVWWHSGIPRRMGREATLAAGKGPTGPPGMGRRSATV